jgi:CBS domain-containing protein
VDTMARIRDVHRTAVVADEDDRLVEVACRMRDDDVDALVVMHRGQMIGIITERELVEAVADGVDLERAVAGDFMTALLVPVELDTGLEEAARALRDADARQLAVVAGGHVVGTLSARELVRAGIP